MLKTYVINLKRDTQKLQEITRRLAPLPTLDVEIVEGVDGAALSLDELAHDVDIDAMHSRYDVLATLLTAGCALSHRHVYRRMISGEIPAALILEDDAILSSTLEAVATRLADAIATDDTPTVVMLVHGFEYRERETTELCGVAVVEPTTCYSTVGYIANLAAARLLAEAQTPVAHFADDWAYFRSLKPSEGPALRIIATLPPQISYPDTPGAITAGQRQALRHASATRRLRAALGRAKGRLRRLCRRLLGYRIARHPSN